MILSKKLKEIGIQEDTISNIIDEINREDLLKMCNRDILSTDQKGKSFFKTSFNYVEPVPFLLGSDENGLAIVQLKLVPVTPTVVPSSLNTPSNFPCTQDTIWSPSLPLGRPWHVAFLVNWDRMPAAIRKALTNKTRPSPSDRKDMVRAVVDQMLDHDPNPNRTMCHNIARSIVRSHPKCFADVAKNGDILGDGCHSFLQQIKTRLEYKTRNNTLARRRRERTHSQVPDEGRGMTRGPVDQYGCVRWSCGSSIWRNCGIIRWHQKSSP
ncbi:unnamed protein product [Leuciscus chuanchicus]